MAAVRPRVLVQAILDAVQQSGYSGIMTSKIREHPRRLIITTVDGSKSLSLCVYIWTLTHGGRKTLPNEYRIQMTTVTSPLPLNPDGPTVLMGYEPNHGLFAGFDLERHRTFTEGSASVQVDIRRVEDALQHGLTFFRKTNQEITCGIRPDQFMNYVLNAAELHKYGKQPRTLALMDQASSLQEVDAVELEALSTPRKKVVQAVARLARDGNFRQQVLHAYGNRCAVTRAQLRLVDAAHILPVKAPGSIGHVKNGLALAPTYHRAFDNGLIYLDETYVMRIQPDKEGELRALNLADGIAGFKAHLGKIYLPPDRNQWPHPPLIRRANRYRQVV